MLSSGDYLNPAMPFLPLFFARGRSTSQFATSSTPSKDLKPPSDIASKVIQSTPHSPHVRLPTIQHGEKLSRESTGPQPPQKPSMSRSNSQPHLSSLSRSSTRPVTERPREFSGRRTDRTPTVYKPPQAPPPSIPLPSLPHASPPSYRPLPHPFNYDRSKEKGSKVRNHFRTRLHRLTPC